MPKNPEAQPHPLQHEARKARRTRNIFRAIAVAAGLSLLTVACSDEVPKAAPSADTVASPEVALNDQINAKAKELANSILDLKNYPHQRTAVMNPVLSMKDGIPGDYETTVNVPAGTLLAGDSGIYQLTVAGATTPEGDIDRDQIHSIYVTMDIHNDGDPGDMRGQLYAFSLFKTAADADWQIYDHHETPGVNTVSNHYLAGPNTGSSFPDSVMLTPDDFEGLASRVENVIGAAQAGAPVNAVPNK